MNGDLAIGFALNILSFKQLVIFNVVSAVVMLLIHVIMWPYLERRKGWNFFPLSKKRNPLLRIVCQWLLELRED
jgi:hypothetical protein